MDRWKEGGKLPVKKSRKAGRRGGWRGGRTRSGRTGGWEDRGVGGRGEGWWEDRGWEEGVASAVPTKPG